MRDQEIEVPFQRDNINKILKGASPEIRALLKKAHAQDFTVVPTSGGHFKVSTPRGVRPMRSEFSPKTPSDTRGLHRVRSKLRKIGVEF
jgi:hypothetical protein